MLQDEYEYDDGDGEFEDEGKIAEEYKDWKKSAPLLYDLCITEQLESPSLTVEWFNSVYR